MATNQPIKQSPRLIQLWVVLSIVLALAPRWVNADEMTVRAELKSESARLLERGDIGAYDQRATELRRSGERTPAGIWKLSLFYKGPDNWPAPQADAPIWTRIEAATESYLHEHPDSPSAIVAHARMLVSHAWMYRGSGWSRDLSTSQRNGFNTFLERAREVLDQHREVGSGDPEWYSLRIQVMNGQGTEKAAILSLAREALDHEPTYQPIDYVAANAFLPKWGGSAAELQQFIALAVTKSSVAQGTQAYARIMFNIARADPEPVTALAQAGVQWPVLRASLREIAAAYPDLWNLNAERAMACLIGTQPDYNAVLPRVSPGLISVAWFDSVSPWPECQRRQERAQQSAAASWAQAFVSTPPSVNFVEALTAGMLTALALLYFARRSRTDESPLLEDYGGSPLGGGEYPRIYRVTPAWRAGIVLLGGLLLLGSLVAAWEFGVVAVESRNSPQGLILVYFLAVVTSGAAIYCVDTLVSSIALKADRLEIHELWRVRCIRRTDIETQQVLHPQNSPAVLVLRLKAPSRRKIKLPIMWNRDSTWQAWFAGIPDVDVEAAKAFEAAVATNADLGSTPAERQQKLSAARSLARIAIGANTGLVLWAFIYPHPYELILFVLAALPWVAVWIMARSPGLYTFNAPRGSGRPDLTLLLISPGFVLMVRALRDVQILDWQRLIPWAVLVALTLMGGVIWALPAVREKLGMAVLTLVLVLAYGFGVTSLANALLDGTRGSNYPATVYGKYVTSGRNRTPTMRLGAWGPRAAVEDVTVPWDVYRSTNIGEKVCVLSHPGALGVPWYRIATCQPRTEPDPPF
jgi:hypothetical protein